MNTLLYYWIQSVREIFSSALITRFEQAVRRYLYALKLFMFHFGLLVILDSVVSLFFGKDFFYILSQAAQGKNEASMSMLLLQMTSGITWFIIGAGLLVLIRLKKYSRSLINYLKMYLLRYVQLSLMFSLILFFFVLFIINLGITKLPMPHWSVVLSMRLIELLTMFFWLDSHFTPKDLLVSLERGINFFVYNVPFFGLIIMLIYLSDYGLKFLLLQAGVAEAAGVNFSLFSSTLRELKNIDIQTISMSRIVGFKYLKFLIDYFWITIAYVLYDQSKHISFATSFFDPKKVSEDEEENDDDDDDHNDE